MTSETNKRILSGMRSTNPRLHIGNYEGALRNWVDLQNEGFDMFCMVADWHALTLRKQVADDPMAVERGKRKHVKEGKTQVSQYSETEQRGKEGRREATLTVQECARHHLRPADEARLQTEAQGEGEQDGLHHIAQRTGGDGGEMVPSRISHLRRTHRSGFSPADAKARQVRKDHHDRSHHLKVLGEIERHSAVHTGCRIARHVRELTVGVFVDADREKDHDGHCGDHFGGRDGERHGLPISLLGPVPCDGTRLRREAYATIERRMSKNDLLTPAIEKAVLVYINEDEAEDRIVEEELEGLCEATRVEPVAGIRQRLDRPHKGTY
ncbi:hypothetical protein EON82_25925, partial [bacterium]